jgi:hypothetical protein
MGATGAVVARFGARENADFRAALREKGARLFDHKKPRV